MTGWLVVNGFLHSEKFDELADLFLRAAKKETVELLIKKNNDLLVDTGIEDEDFPDFVIFWDKDILLAKSLEQRGIHVYNCSEAIAICDDKRKTHLALQRAQLPMPRTIFAPMSYEGIGFSDVDFLQAIINRLGFPIVIKEAFGSFGEQVYLVKEETELYSLVSRCKTTNLLFQEYVATSEGKDIRLQVVGDNVIGAMLRHSETDFRANITAGGHMEAYVPSEEEKKLAILASKAVGTDFAGVDLLFGDTQMLVCEVNSNAHFKNLMDCTNINTAEKIIRYIVENIGRKIK